MKRCCIAFFVALLLTQAIVAQHPAPSPATPFGQLEPAGVVPNSTGMYEAIAKLEESLQAATKKLSQDPKPDTKEYAKYYVQVNQLLRWVPLLEHYREPAAVDWQFRSSFYRNKLLEIRNRYYATPPAAQMRDKAIVSLTRGATAREKALQKALEAVRADQAKQAENMVEKIRADAQSMTSVLHDPDKKPVYEPIAFVENEVRQQMASVRKREAAEAEQAEIAKLQESIAQCKQLLASGDGADTLQTAAQLLKAIHFQRLRVQAFASANKSGGPQLSSDDSAGFNDATNDSSADTGAFDDLKSAMGDFVARHAKTVASEDARRLHFEFQSVLTDLLLIADDSAWESALQKALNELAKKGQFSAEVFNYGQATDELLRWRERCAQEWADSTKLETVAGLAKSQLTSQDNYTGIYERNQHTPLPLILKALPDVVPDVQTKLVGKLIRTAKVLPAGTGDQATWLSQSDDGYYCVLSANTVNTQVLPQLRDDLLCLQDKPPLTLKASMALRSAEQGCCEAAGGTITTFALEGFVSRMTHMNAEKMVLYPLGSLGPDLQGNVRRSLMMRCDLKPTWLQHRYYFVSVDN